MHKLLTPGPTPFKEDPASVWRRLKEAGFVVGRGIGPSESRAIRVGLFGRQALDAAALVEVLRAVA